MNKLTPEERERRKQEALEERYRYESSRMGGYELIYPSSSHELNEKYDKFIMKSNEIWDDFTTGKRGMAKKAELTRKQKI